MREWVKLLAIGAYCFAESPQTGGFANFPFGIAVPQTGAAYLQAPNGRVLAIELKSGNLLWSSTVLGRPLALADGKLIADSRDSSSHELKMISFDPKTGTLQKPQISISFPDNVNTKDSAFSYVASLDGSKMRVQWSYHPSFRGGIARSPSALPPPSLDASGVSLVDLERGIVSPQEWAPVSPRPPEPAGQIPVSYRRFFAWHSEAWQFGSTFVQLFAAPTFDGKQVTLVKTQTGSASQDMHIGSAKQPYAYVTPDGAYVFLLRAGLNAPQPWDVYAVDGGQKVGTLNFEQSSDCPAVVGSIAYWILEQPTDGTVQRSLRAADLHSGRILWTVALGSQPKSAGHRPG